MMNLRRVGMIGGSLMVIAGIAAILRVPYFYYHSARQGHQLLKQATQMATSPPDIKAKETLPDGLLGEVEIPSLNLKAPMVEGTKDSQLAEGVGHLSTSVMPGQNGTSVIAAHNATWFRHINRLAQGDIIDVTTRAGTTTFTVVKRKVVNEGTPVYNTSSPTIILETCYPTDALYLTPYRLLVYGKLTKSGSAIQPNLVNSNNRHFTAQIPTKIRKQGITLKTNSLPLGTLTYDGHPANAFVQSNQPLNVSSVAVQLYLAWVHASANKDVTALKALCPVVERSALNPLYGHPSDKLTYPGHFNITLSVDRTTLKAVKAAAVVQTAGGRRYGVDILYSVNGSNIGIEDITFKRLK